MKRIYTSLKLRYLLYIFLDFLFHYSEWIKFFNVCCRIYKVIKFINDVTISSVLDYVEIKSNDKNQFLCPRCFRPYRFKSSVYTHLKHDCGKRHQYRCDPCDFTCKFEHVLRRHKLSMSHQKRVNAIETKSNILGDDWTYA